MVIHLPCLLGIGQGGFESRQVKMVGGWRMRVVYWGGKANNGANAGLGYANSNNGWSNSNSNIGSRHTMEKDTFS